MNSPQMPQRFEFDVTPLFKTYMDNLEAWKKSYEAVTKSAPPAESTKVAEQGVAQIDNTMQTWQKSGQELYRHLIEQQIEWCRFYSSRLECYLELPEQLSHCGSIGELARIQSNFFSKAVSDYLAESNRLSKPMVEFMMHWMPRRAA